MRHYTFIAATIILVAGPAFAQINSVSIKFEEVMDVDKSGGKDHKELKKTSLKITVGNVTQNDLGDLQVRYFLFTKAVKADKPVMKELGSKRVRLDKGGSDTVETKDVEVTYVPQRYEKDKHGKPHVIPPSGERFVGSFVQVRKGGKPVGQQLDSRLKDEVDVKALDSQFNSWEKAQAEKEKPKPKNPPPPKKK